MNNTLLTIAMPVYNQRNSIKGIVADWLGLINNFFGKDEKVSLVIVDNGSNDGTTEILKDLAKNESKIKLVSQAHKPFNQTLLDTYNEALALDSEYVFQVNGDASLLASEFHKIWERHQIGKLLLADRKKSKDRSLSLRLAIRLLYGVNMKDVAVPYRLIRSDYLKAMLKELPSPLPQCPNIYMALMAKSSGMGMHNVAIKIGKGSDNVYEDSKGALSEVIAQRGKIKRSALNLVDLNEPM